MNGSATIVCVASAAIREEGFNMDDGRVNFVDEYEARPAPRNVWLTRSIITSLIAGIGAVGCMFLFGYITF